MQSGLFQRSLGGRVSVNWQSGTAVGGSGGGNGKLTVSDLVTVNIDLFANLAGRFGGRKAPAWLQGTRITFGITNLFDARLRVRDVNGWTPLSYQPAYLDPVGRFISLGLRKTF